MSNFLKSYTYAFAPISVITLIWERSAPMSAALAVVITFSLVVLVELVRIRLRDSNAKPADRGKMVPAKRYEL